MKLNDKEWQDAARAFERDVKPRGLLGKEDRALWRNGNVYQNGEVNNLFRSYMHGYSFGRSVYLNGGPS